MNQKTTRWGVIAGVGLAFVLFAPDLFSQIPYAGPYILALAKFAAIGGLAGLGIAAADSRAAK